MMLMPEDEIVLLFKIGIFERYCSNISVIEKRN